MSYIPSSKNDGDLINFESDILREFFDYPFNKVGKNMQMMKTDIRDKGDHYIFDLDIPGYDIEDLKIHLGEKYLTVYATKAEKQEQRNDSHGYIYQERHVGSCSRSFYVGNIRENDIKAQYKNGTLTITVPKVKEEDENKKRWIPISYE